MANGNRVKTFYEKTEGIFSTTVFRLYSRQFKSLDERIRALFAGNESKVIGTNTKVNSVDTIWQDLAAELKVRGKGHIVDYLKDVDGANSNTDALKKIIEDRYNIDLSGMTEEKRQQAEKDLKLTARFLLAQDAVRRGQAAELPGDVNPDDLPSKVCESFVRSDPRTVRERPPLSQEVQNLVKSVQTIGTLENGSEDVPESDRSVNEERQIYGRLPVLCEEVKSEYGAPEEYESVDEALKSASAALVDYSQEMGGESYAAVTPSDMQAAADNLNRQLPEEDRDDWDATLNRSAYRDSLSPEDKQRLKNGEDVSEEGRSNMRKAKEKREKEGGEGAKGKFRLAGRVRAQVAFAGAQAGNRDTYPKKSPVRGKCPALLFSSIKTIEFSVNPKGKPAQDQCLFKFSGDSLQDLSNKAAKPEQIEASLWLKASLDEIYLKTITKDYGSLTFSAKIAVEGGKAFHLALRLISDVKGTIQVKINGGEDQELVTADGKKPDFLFGSDNFFLNDVLIGTDSAGTASGPGAFTGELIGPRFWTMELSDEQLGQVAKLSNAFMDQSFSELYKNAPSVQLSGLAGFVAGYITDDVGSFYHFVEPGGAWMLENSWMDVPVQAEDPKFAPEEHCRYMTPEFLGCYKNKNRQYVFANDRELSADGKPNNIGFPFEFDSRSDINYPWKGQAANPFSLNFYIDPEAYRTALEALVNDELQEVTLASFTLLEAREDFGFQKGAYIRPYKKPSMGKDATAFGDVWAELPSNLKSYSLPGWDVKTMHPWNPQTAGREVFSLPGGDSRDYSKSSDGMAVIPHGFMYTPSAYAGGYIMSSFISSEQEYVDEVSQSHNFNIELFNVKFDRNRTVQEMVGKSQLKENTMTVSRYQATSHTIVLDKSNVKLSNKQDTSGRNYGLFEDFKAYLQGTKSAGDILTLYGTHYAEALRYGSKGLQTSIISKDAMSTLLENKTVLNWGIGAQVKSTIGASVSAGAASANVSTDINNGLAYDQSKAEDHRQKVAQTLGKELGKFECYGGNGCSGDGKSDSSGNLIPIFFNFRPISELLGPPFFLDDHEYSYEQILNARMNLAKQVQEYLGNTKPSFSSEPAYVQFAGKIVLNEWLIDPNVNSKEEGTLTIPNKMNAAFWLGQVFDKEGRLVKGGNDYYSSELTIYAEIKGEFIPIKSIKVSDITEVSTEIPFWIGVSTEDLVRNKGMLKLKIVSPAAYVADFSLLDLTNVGFEWVDSGNKWMRIHTDLTLSPDENAGFSLQQGATAFDVVKKIYDNHKKQLRPVAPRGTVAIALNKIDLESAFYKGV